jgi:hypothetical protein
LARQLCTINALQYLRGSTKRDSNRPEQHGNCARSGRRTWIYEHYLLQEKTTPAMPVESNSDLSVPADLSERVWRYMDLAKLVSLISKGELYFCNLEVLGKSDPHEGLLSQPNYRHRQWRTISDITPEEQRVIFLKPMNPEESRIQFESHRNCRDYWLRRRFYDRRTFFVNCWLWTQYSTGGPGVAITSSYKRIVDALKNAPQGVLTGKVTWTGLTSQSKTHLRYLSASG